jgi:hypothetical protein
VGGLVIEGGGSVGERRDKRRAATTVKINVHLTADGSTAVGVIRSEWQGATRVDYRVKGLERRPLPPVPPGVSEELWAALCTLHAMCKQQQAAAARPAAD